MNEQLSRLDVTIRDEVESSPIIQASLMQWGGAPKLVLADLRTVYICKFTKKNKVQLERKLRLAKDFIAKVGLMQSGELAVFCDNGFTCYYDAKGNKKRYWSNSNDVPAKTCFMEIGDRFTLQCSVQNEIVVLNSSITVKDKGILYRSVDIFGLEVIDLKWISSDKYAMISKDIEFHYQLSIYSVSGVEGRAPDHSVLLKRYNPFKERPVMMASLPSYRTVLVICDGTHHLYPLPGMTLSKDFSNDKSVKMTKVSFFRNLEKDIPIHSMEVVDEHRLLLTSKIGNVYMYYINMAANGQRKEIRLKEWTFISLGKLAPYSKILHINDNLFLNYSRAAKNCFFTIESKTPNIRVLEYFDMLQLTESQNTKSKQAKREFVSESLPIAHIERISFFEYQKDPFYLTLQASEMYSLLTLVLDEAPISRTDYSKMLKGRKAMTGMWSFPKVDCMVLVFEGKTLEIWKEGDQLVNTFQMDAEPKSCHLVNDEFIVCTETQVIRLKDSKSEVLSTSELQDMSVKRIIAHSMLFASPGNTRLYLKNGLFTLPKFKWDVAITCIDLYRDPAANDADTDLVAYGTECGSVIINSEIWQQASNYPILDVIYLNERFVLVVDSNNILISLRKLDDGTRVIKVEFQSKGKFEIVKKGDGEGMLMKTNGLITECWFDSSNILKYKVIKFGTTSDIFCCTGSEFIIYDPIKNKIAGLDLRKFARSKTTKRKELYFEGAFRKAIFINVDEKFPMAVVVGGNVLQLVDLETFKVIDRYTLPLGEAILDIVKLETADLNTENVKDSELTERDVSLVQEELRNNGAFVNTAHGNETSVRLFTIGDDMRFKFHYMKKNVSQDETVCYSYKLMSRGDIVISAGHLLNFFKIGLNQNFHSTKTIPKVTDDNYEDRSVVKISDFSKYVNVGKLTIDMVDIGQGCIAVLGIPCGVKFYRIKKDSDDKVTSKEIEIGHLPEVLGMVAFHKIAVFQKNNLILISPAADFLILSFTPGPGDFEFEVVSWFKLTKPMPTSVVGDNYGCLVGFADGSVIRLNVGGSYSKEEQNMVKKDSYRHYDADEYLDLPTDKMEAAVFVPNFNDPRKVLEQAFNKTVFAFQPVVYFNQNQVSIYRPKREAMSREELYETHCECGGYGTCEYCEVREEKEKERRIEEGEEFEDDEDDDDFL